MKKKKTISVKQWPKNKREEIRIMIGPYRGREMFSARVWYRGALGVYKPGRMGINLEVSHLSKVIVGLKRARKILNEQQSSLEEKSN
jgi:Transcriptional Coactivator p15 (PC4)